MGHGPRRRPPPPELRVVQTPNEVKHLTAAEFYRSLIITKNKKTKLHCFFFVFFNGARLLPACLQKNKLFLDVLFRL